MSSSPEIDSRLPLTETTFFILLSLSPGPRHGYAIMKDVQALSDGRVILSTGTLYGALKRLLEQNWIERREEKSEPGNGRERKAYTLTHLGRRVLEAEIARLHRLVAAVHSRPVNEGALAVGGGDAGLKVARAAGASKGPPQ